MVISNLLPAAISNVSNFHYLALFVCHLFGNGPFRTAHILYNPNVFDYNRLMQINSICTNPIPFYLTDTTQSFPKPYQENDNVDNILQLFFIDSENLAHEIELLDDNFVLYRIFVFSSTDEIRKIDQKLLFETRNRIYDTRTLILHYNESSVSVNIENSLNEQSNEGVNLGQKAIFILNQETNHENVNLFDRTFGEYERMESIKLYRLNYYVWRDKLEPTSYLLDFFINYCHLHLNRSYINIIWKNKFNWSIPLIYHRTVIENQQPYYKESSRDYKFIEDETL